MTVNISVNLVSAKDRLTQKCIVPIELLQNINARIGDYVTVQTSKNKYLCQVQITLLPINRLFVDDIITASDYQRRSNNLETVNVPDDFTKIEPLCFNHIGVKIVFKDNEDTIQSQKTVYEDVVQKILSSYVFGTNCVIKCRGMKLADLFHISHIIILQTSPGAYGKLNKSSKVSIIKATWEEQMHQINEFRRLQLGGTRDALNILKTVVETSILVLGPSGCGKSSLIMKLCSDVKCFFVIIDGLRTKNLTHDKCKSIERKFFSYLNIFPDNRCVLFIDHIDAIAPCDSKDSSPKPITLPLATLIRNLKNTPVVIISAAVQRSDIDPQISNLFNRQVNLGMPSPEQRKEIIRCLIKSFTCDFDYNKLWHMTPGFVAHDLKLLVQEVLNNKEKSENSQETDTKCLTLQDFEKALVNISPSILKSSIYYMKVKPVYWKDIDGMVNIKERLQMNVELPLHDPELFRRVGLPCPRGVLLFGPPGCCKTTLARGLATECKANFFAANPAQIYSCYVGESEKKITELFYQARVSAPSIIFLDELDSLVSQRKLDQQSQGVGEKVLSALLNEMDGFGSKVQLQNTLNAQKLLNSLDGRGDTKEDHSSDNVIVVAATNRPDLIDDALLRPGRFDKILYVPPPNEEERELILQTCIKDIILKNVNLKNIAAQTHLYSGADLKQLCNEAKMNACRTDESASSVTAENFDEALRKVQPSISNQQIEEYEKLQTKYGSTIK